MNSPTKLTRHYPITGLTQVLKLPSEAQLIGITTSAYNPSLVFFQDANPSPASLIERTFFKTGNEVVDGIVADHPSFRRRLEDAACETFIPLDQGRTCLDLPAGAVITHVETWVGIHVAVPKQFKSTVHRTFWVFGCNESVSGDLACRLEPLGIYSGPRGSLSTALLEVFEEKH